MMRRRRKNQKKEKMIMLCSSAFVLTALTMTGLYVKEKNQQQDDGYVIDLSQLEAEQEASDVPEEGNTEPSAEVSSGKVENQSNLPKELEMPWDDSFAQEIEEYRENEVQGFLEPKEELTFSQEDSLLWPIVGNVLINYSMDSPVYFPTLEQYKCSPAIVIQAKEGQNVMASADGIVSKIEKTEELGNVITMDIGNGYEMSYGQVTNLQVKEGDSVKQGDYIADVAPPTKYYSVEGSNIYFALRKDGTPVNPMLQLQ